MAKKFDVNVNLGKVRAQLKKGTSGGVAKAAKELAAGIAAIDNTKASPTLKAQVKKGDEVGLNKLKSGLLATAEVTEGIAKELEIQGTLMRQSSCVNVFTDDHPSGKFRAGVTSPDGNLLASPCYFMYNDACVPGVFNNQGTELDCNIDGLNMKSTYVQNLKGGSKSRIRYSKGQRMVRVSVANSPAEAQAEKQYASNFPFRFIYHGDEVHLMKKGAVVEAEVVFSQQTDSYHHTGGAINADGFIERGSPAQFHEYNGQRDINACTEFGSLVLGLPMDSGQFLYRKATVTVTEALSHGATFRVDPCDPGPATITVIGLCPGDPCSNVVSTQGLGLGAHGHAIVLTELGDYVTVMLVLGPDGKPCWRVMESNLKEKGPPCPDRLMDHHFLPSWTERRAFFLDGPRPWLAFNEDGSSQSMQNPEIPTIYYPHREDAAASFLFKPPALRCKVLYNVHFLISHPTPNAAGLWELDAQGASSNPGKLLVSLWGRNGIGGHRQVLAPMPTQSQNIDPGNPSFPGPDSVFGFGAGEFRDSGMLSLIDESVHPGGLPQWLHQNGGGVQGAQNMIMDKYMEFLVMKIGRDKRMRIYGSTFVHSILYSYIPTAEFQAAWENPIVDNASVLNLEWDILRLTD
jgi:hypothetical protein